MQLLNDPAGFIIATAYLLPALLLGFVLHEMAHAYVAVAQGDDTPRRDGRLSPDPRRHLDPIGLVMVILLHFGYAKPVRITPSRFKNEYSHLMVALAGPVTNLVIAGLASIPLHLMASRSLFGLFFGMPCPTGGNPADILQAELFYIYSLNLFLFVFNLLPVPPLDGFEMLATALRRNNPRLLFQIETNRQMIVMGFFLVAFVLPSLGLPNILFIFIRAVVTPIASLLGVPIQFPCG